MAHDGLRNKNALISAASSGIGKAVARALADEGCNIHIFSRHEEKIRSVAEELSRDTGSQVNYSVADMTNPDEVRKVMQDARERTGNIDLLIVNFGDPKVAPFLEIPIDEWDANLNMFIKSPLVMTHAVLPSMMSKGFGRIVFITSLTTKHVMENFAISASLRAAVVSLSKVISLEFSGKGITSNSISQGYIMTPRLESIAERNSKKFNIPIDKAYDEIRQNIPARRFGKPEEIGHLVTFLCSDEASYINGANIQIDGGMIRFPL
ncbi:MAG: SDR family oxidoreductase [Thermoplasmataceae archaeon]